MPLISFAKQSRHVTSSIPDEETVPGPGTYQIRPIVGADKPAATMMTRRDSRTKLKRDKSIPGPGKYDAYIPAKKRAPLFKIGNQKRFDATKSAAEQTKLNENDARCYSPNYCLIQQNSPMFGFGSELREANATLKHSMSDILISETKRRIRKMKSPHIVDLEPFLQTTSGLTFNLPSRPLSTTKNRKKKRNRDSKSPDIGVLSSIMSGGVNSQLGGKSFKYSQLTANRIRVTCPFCRAVNRSGNPCPCKPQPLQNYDPFVFTIQPIHQSQINFSD